MSSHKYVMDEVHKLLEEHQEQYPGTSLVLLAVEFSPEGFPSSKTLKITGSPANSIAGLKIMEDMIEHGYDDIRNQIKQAGSRVNKIQQILDMLEENKVESADFMNLLDSAIKDAGTPDEIRELIADFKKKFGK